MTLLDIIRKKKLVTVTDVTDVTVTPVLKPSVTSVTPVTVTNQETNKVAFPEKPAPVKAVTPENIKLEERREKVLQMLIDRPKIQRAFVTDTLSDPDNVILAMAIRGVATFEMHVPRDKYDPFAVLQVIEKGLVQ